MTHPVYPLAKTVADIDIDPLSFMLGGPTRDMPLIADQTELAAVVREVAGFQHRIVTPDSARRARQSLPVRYAGFLTRRRSSGGGWHRVGRGRQAQGWGRHAFDLYNELHYHQPSDNYDPNWDWSGALKDLDFFYRVGDRLARSDSWPNWYPNDEFRAARDAVLKARP